MEIKQQQPQRVVVSVKYIKVVNNIYFIKTNINSCIDIFYKIPEQNNLKEWIYTNRFY